MSRAVQFDGERKTYWADEGGEQLTVLRDLLIGGEFLPGQLPSPSHWSPGLRLAGAVLARAMADIRSRRRDGRDHTQVSAAIRWVRSNDVSWPLSFLRVCSLFQLDPAWVRGRVDRWMRGGGFTNRNAGMRRAA